MSQRGSTVERGYGQAHRVRRQREAKRVARGDAFCARCHQWISPDEPWDLGHNPYDRSEWIGAMHVRCNRDTRLERSLRMRTPRVMRTAPERWL